ncbi:MAG: OmpA family protein [Bacteroidota bacterium]|jgi:outer membrane protein OmpA-like peptidoglycan-associated protein
MKFIVMILAFGFSLCSFAQTKIHFRDNFEDNRNAWYENSNNNECQVAIKEGNYVFDVKNNSAYWQNRWFGISAATSFTVETSVIKQPGGYQNACCGLMLYKSNWDRLMFLINPTNGDFVFTKNTVQDNGWEDFVKWSTNDAIKSEGNRNVLRIEKTKNSIKLLINGKEVYSSSEVKIMEELSGHVHMQAGYGKIVAEFDYLEVSYETNVKMVEECLKGFKKVNLGSNVNSKHIEICPLISPDGKTLFFTSRDNPSNIGGKSDDIYYCDAINDTTWTPRKNIGKPLNNSGTNTMVSITPDRNYALVMNEYDKSGNIIGDGVSSAKMSANGWNNPEKIKIDKFQNKKPNVEYCLSADGNVLIMAIETDKTNGLRDLYVSFKNLRNNIADKNKADNMKNKTPKETWSEPMNLGPIINSKGEDFTPFLAADGMTLYFSSNGHNGFGNCDIFMSRRLDSTWTNWSEPLNLGPEINGFGWEAYYVVPASGKYAYMVSLENTLGETDIVRIEQNANAKPKPVILVKGRVINSKTKEPIEAPIIYRELKTNTEIGTAVSNAANGSYQIVLPYGTNYSLSSEKKGFFAVNDNLDASNITEYKEIERDLYLTPIEIGSIVRLNNIFFDVNKATLQDASFPELERIVKFLKENKGMEIEIGGHTDSDGPDEYNLKLSEERTKTVVGYLISKGIESSVLKFKGYGETNPIKNNDSEENKAMNRRVEFKVLKK